MSFTRYEGNGNQQPLFKNEFVGIPRKPMPKKNHKKHYWIGTSGFSYDDWVGEVYPERLNKNKWFDYYCSLFNALELNMSYYRLPSKKVIFSFLNRAPKDFFLSVKAHQTITHKKQMDFVPAFNDLMSLIGGHGMHAVLLLQFPNAFKYQRENFVFLQGLCDILNCKKAVEFRDDSWNSREIRNWAQDNSILLVSVDEPRLKGLMPPTLVDCNGMYVRFHGRNAARWWRHEKAYERYDYLYSDEELLEWVKKIRMEPEKPIVFFFNNHYKGQSVKNALMFSELLEKNIKKTFRDGVSGI
ncbi:MAG: DUF72 domain-containing protein [Thermotogota bacterium]